MKSLSKIQWSAIPKAKKAQLEQWLDLRRADLHLRSTFEQESDTSSSSQRSDEQQHGTLHIREVAPFDGVVAIGQIRLLAPELSPDLMRPLYFAVLKEWDSDTYLIAPFSPYALPATTGELLLHDVSVHFKVLCLWNARTVAKTLVAKSWLVGDLTDDQLKEAWAVFRHAIAGHSLSDAVCDRVGLPIYTSADPRMAYEGEEAAHLEKLISLSEAALESAQNDADLPDQARTHLMDISEVAEPLAWAAAAGGESAKCEFGAEDNSYSVCFYAGGSVATNSILVAVYDANGNQSLSLDGARFLTSSGRELAVVANGTATLPRESAADGLVLRDNNGRLVQLHKKQA
jgi:hypothetical protein